MASVWMARPVIFVDIPEQLVRKERGTSGGERIPDQVMQIGIADLPVGVQQGFIRRIAVERVGLTDKP